MEITGFAKNIIETTHESLIVLDGNFKVIYANQKFFKTFAVKSKDTIGNFIFDLGNKQWSIPKLRKLLEQIVPKNTKIENYEVEHKFPNVGNKIMLLNAHRIHHESTGQEMILLAIEDVTERSEMARELGDSEELFRRLFETSKDGLLLIDKMEKKIVKVNPAMVELLGYDKKDIIGFNLSEIGIFKDQKLLKTAYQQVLESGFVYFNNNKVQNKSGQKIQTELYLVDRAKLIQCNVRNITERKQMEADLLRSQKLESIGLLAGGIAHDFNNLITAIHGNINLARLNIDRNNKAYELLREADKASRRAGELTQRLLTFSKGGVPIKKPTAISKIVKECTTLALSGTNIRYEFQIPKDLWVAEVDEAQFNQLCFNLMTNARQALPDGGNIKILAENKNLKTRKGISLKPGKYVQISIQDDGVGISEENLPKIFDPYFTTKKNGKGLGLTVAYSVVKSHNGDLMVDSTLGSGTTFTLYFPASKKGIIKKKSIDKKSFFGKGRVLIMDDEEMVRRIIGELLKHMGYEVGFASEGSEAIKMYAAAQGSGKPFDVVIMDLTIPGGMGGKEGILELKKIDPKAKVIVASGYSNDPVMANFKKYGFKASISKPFTIEDIGKILQEVLM